MTNPTLLICTLAALAALPAHALPGTWPSARQNPSLTNIQPMPGRMATEPQVLARYGLPRHAPPVVPVEGSDMRLCIVGGALYGVAPDGGVLWSSHPRELNFTRVVAAGDLNRDGRLLAVLRAASPGDPLGAAVLVSLDDGHVLWRYDVDANSYYWTMRVGDFVPDTPGQDIAISMQGLEIDPDYGYIALFVFNSETGQVEQRWRFNFDDYTNYPNILQPDLDGDGIPEVAVITHSRIWTFAAVTGAVRQYLKWDVSPANKRSFGLNRFVDLNGDGRDDLLVIGNFSVHHEVLLNRDGQLELAWVHGWKDNVTTSAIQTKWAEPPQADLDGDGRLEIVLSMRNLDGDGRWQLRVYDALTGELEYTMPDRIAVATGDFGGRHPMILANVPDQTPEALPSNAVLLEAGEGQLRERWRDEGTVAAWDDGAFLARGRDRFRLAADGAGGWTLVPAPVGRTKPVAATPRIEAGPDLPVQYNEDRWLLAGPLVEEDVNDLVVFVPPVFEQRSGDGPYGQRRAARPSALVGTGRVLRLSGETLREVATFESSTAPVIADMDGDGRNELVTCIARPDAPPTVSALRFDASGATETVWSRQLPEAAAAGKPHYRLATLAVGHFTSTNHKDIYLHAAMPRVRSLALDGRTGDVLWERHEFEEIGRYVAPTHHAPAVHDVDGDGFDDLVFTCPDYYCALDGATGETLIEPVWPPRIFSQQSPGLYTMTVLLERDGEEPLVCLSGGHYFLAVMTLRAEPLWHHIPALGEARYGREGFLRLPDGNWIIGVGREDGRFTCHNAIDGSVRWEMALEAAPYDIATGDVDGDGRFEFVIGTSHGDLYAIGDAGGIPRLVWHSQFEHAVGPPILADLNADGASEIVVPTAAGEVLVLGVH